MLLLLFFVTVLYIVTAIKVKNYLIKKKETFSTENPRDLNLLATKMIISAILIILILVDVVFIVLHYDEYPWGRVLTIFFLYTFSNGVTWVQLSSFNPKGKVRSNKDSNLRTDLT